MNEPMPNFATSLGPSTSQLIFGKRDKERAACASKVGVAWLAGRLAHSLAISMPATVATACSKAGFNSALSGTSTVTLPRLKASAEGLDLVVV